MKIFDEAGNPIGELYADSLESIKDSASESFSEGTWIWGIILLLIFFPSWAIFCGILYLLFKLFALIFRLAFFLTNLYSPLLGGSFGYLSN